jgi:hypothetical protein
MGQTCRKNNMKKTYIVFIGLVTGIEYLLTKWAISVPQMEMKILIIIIQLLLLLTFNVITERK